MAELKILSPVAEKKREKGKAAPKLNDLRGKRIGLFWNHKPGGEIILAHTAELLKKRYSGITFRNYLGDRTTSIPPAQLEAVVKDECDAVVASTAD
jgi:hypothetical protein